MMPAEFTSQTKCLNGMMRYQVLVVVPSEDVKKLGSTLNTLGNEKQKEEKVSSSHAATSDTGLWLMNYRIMGNGGIFLY